MRGHVRQRGTGWELRIYVGRDPVTERKKYVTRTVRGTKSEAEDELAKLIVKLSGGGFAAQDATVGDLVRQWFAMARGELSPTTVRSYERYIDKFIIPHVGKIRLSRLGPAELDRFYAQLRDHGGLKDGGALAPATVRQIHAILRRALKQGVRWGWIATNPAALASPPRVVRHELDPPEPDEVVRLIEAADQAEPQFGCLLRVAATTGARRGELCGLRWKDVNLDSGTLTISRSVVEGTHGIVLEKDTKTHSARRISLDPVTADALKDQHQRSADRALACETTIGEDAYVFSRIPEARTPLTPGDVTKAFIALRNRCKLPTVRLHDLRHFTATRLLAAGIPVRTVSGRLGHANAVTTLGVYAHFVEASDRDAAGAMGALLGPRSADTDNETAP